MNVESLRAIQRDMGLEMVHLVYVGERHFTVAHTDAERAAAADLTECPLHEWLVGLAGPPEAVGIYTAVSHEPDAYSEPYGADPWDLDPLVSKSVSSGESS